MGSRKDHAGFHLSHDAVTVPGDEGNPHPLDGHRDTGGIGDDHLDIEAGVARREQGKEQNGPP